MSYDPTTWANGDIITAVKMNKIESGVQSVNNNYTPTTWVNGDIITAVKLNNIEQGIANAGGGGGDYSAAQVTVTISNENVEWINLAFTENNGDYGEISAGAIANSGTYSVILYKGQAFGWIQSSVPPFMLNVSTTGDIEYDDDIIVTGDGTITIS